MDDKSHIEQKLSLLYTNRSLQRYYDCVICESLANLEYKYKGYQHQGDDLYTRVQNNEHVDVRFDEDAVKWAAVRALQRDCGATSFQQQYKYHEDNCDAVRHLYMEPKKLVDQKISAYQWLFHPARRYSNATLTEESLIDCAQAAYTNMRVFDKFHAYVRYYRDKM